MGLSASDQASQGPGPENPPPAEASLLPLERETGRKGIQELDWADSDQSWGLSG